MPWCPKCKNEYREGVTVCPDCEIELVDELSEEEEENPAAPMPVVFMVCDDRTIGEKAVRFLIYNGVRSAILVQKEDDEEAGEEEPGYTVIVADMELEEATGLFPGLAQGETVDEDRLYELVPDIEDQLEEVENEEASKQFSELRSEASSIYVKKKDKYEDLRFSGYSFIAFGFLGVVLILLNVFHVIRWFNMFSLIVMCAVFAIFFIIGIASLVRAARVRDSVDVEDKFTEELNSWIQENLGDDVIDEWYDENLEDQENYFEIQGRLVRMIEKQFPNIHPSYIEELAEERYNSYLERSGFESSEDVPQPEETEEDVEADESVDVREETDEEV